VREERGDPYSCHSFDAMRVEKGEEEFHSVCGSTSGEGKRRSFAFLPGGRVSVLSSLVQERKRREIGGKKPRFFPLRSEEKKKGEDSLTRRPK